MIPFAHSMKDDSNLNGKQHKGIVVDNKDPEMKMRLKVSIPGILVAPKEELPWSLPIVPAFHGDSDKSAQVYIPEVGTEVVIEFPSNESEFPYWTGRWGLNIVPEPFRENYPERYGHFDRNGTYWYVDKKTKEFKFHHSSGFEATINANGDFHMNVPGDQTWNVAKEFFAKVVGNSTFNTPELHSTGESSDKVRTMSGDRAIYNSHGHPGFHGPTGLPTASQ